MIKDFQHGKVELRKGDLVYAMDDSETDKLKKREIFRVLGGLSKDKNRWALLKAVSKDGVGFLPLPEILSPNAEIVTRSRHDIIFVERATAYRSGDLVRHPEHGRGVVCKVDFGCSPEEDVVVVNFSGTKRVVLMTEVTAHKPGGDLSLLSDQVEVEPERRKKLPQTLHEQETHY